MRWCTCRRTTSTIGAPCGIGELVGFWDFSVFLDAPFEVTVARMAERDGTHPDPGHPSVARYVGGQRLYFAACEPRRRAGVVVDNQDLDRPVRTA